MTALVLTMAQMLGCGGRRLDDARHVDDYDTPELDPEDANNAYQELACSGGIPQFDVCGCDAAVDWSSMTEDVVGNTIDPEKLFRLAFVHFTASSDDLLASICGGVPLEDMDPDRYVDALISGRTSLSLSELSFLGTPFDPHDLERGATWALLWSDSSELAGHTRMMALVSISDGGEDSVTLP